MAGVSVSGEATLKRDMDRAFCQRVPGGNVEQIRQAADEFLIACYHSPGFTILKSELRDVLCRY